MTHNRKRPITYTIKLTADEAAYLDQQVAKSRYKSRADYVLAISRKSKIKYIDANRLVPELARQGNNLNQIAAKINAGYLNDKSPGEIMAVINATRQELVKIWQLLSQ